MQYDNWRDANLYLRNSIVKHQGEAVYITNVNDAMIAKAHNCSTNETLYVPVEELDLKPIKLGYAYSANHKKCYYFERTPRRNWRQGLTSDNCLEREKGLGYLPNIGSQLMRSLVTQRHPRIHRALKIAKKHRTEVPFHRHFSVDMNGTIRYKTKPVGEWSNHSFTLLSNYSYLKEMLEEIKNEHYRGY